jgi:hypothetical protein
MVKENKGFLYQFRNAAIRPEFYKEVLKERLKKAILYFLKLFGLLSLLTIITFLVFLIPTYPYLKNLKDDLPSLYPKELEIEIIDGKVTTNVDEPYFVELKPEVFPEELEKGLNNQPVQNILVIDTQANPSDIKDYQTFALLTKEDVSFIAERNEIRIQSLEEVEEFKVNRQIVNDFWQEVVPYLQWFSIGILVFILIMIPIFTIIGRLIWVAIFSLISLLAAKIMKHQLNYKSALKINLYAVTLPTVIAAAFMLFGADPKIPFFQAIILLIFNLIIFSSLKEKAQ